MNGFELMIIKICMLSVYLTKICFLFYHFVSSFVHDFMNKKKVCKTKKKESRFIIIWIGKLMKWKSLLSESADKLSCRTQYCHMDGVVYEYPPSFVLFWMFVLLWLNSKLFAEYREDG